MLKYLKTLDMWMWEKTHRLLSLAFSESQLRDYTKFDPNLRFGLTEHFYGEQIDHLLEPTIKKVCDNLDALIQSEWKERIVWYFKSGLKVYIENPTAPNFDAMKVDLGQIVELSNISLLAAPDFGVILGPDSYLILDWKSGKEKIDQAEITDQLKIYALKILLNQQRRQLWETKLYVEEIYLPSMQHKGGTITQKDLDDIVHKIIEDVEYQKQFLVDQDPIANIPLPHTHFLRTTAPKKCASCSFRLVCDMLKERE